MSEYKRRMNRPAAFGVPVVLLILPLAFLWGCGEKEHVTFGSAADPQGSLIGHTGTCKDYSGVSKEFPLSSECMRYEYSCDTLFIDHINAGFNCCPGEIVADVDIGNDTIIIAEDETEGLCDCNCLFDTYYRIDGIEPGSYTIVFTGPYVNEEDELLSVVVDLSTSSSGIACVDRSHYPWGH